MPRVAFFTDSFHEVNGVALTSRMLHQYARENGRPFFSFHFAEKPASYREDDFVCSEEARSAFRLDLERDLAFDLLCLRHKSGLLRQVRAFAPDVIHITGPGDAGILGAFIAHQLRVPLVLSWHTNLHEYAGRRLQRMAPFLPSAAWAERLSLEIVCRFYRLGRILLAPSPELCRLLAERTNRPVHHMTRGADTGRFQPARRTRGASDPEIVFGFAGRLSPEKNVRFLRQLEAALESTLKQPFSFLIVGDGAEREWLAANVKRARLTGVLTGDALANAYADMDVFVFPSETDTYGNVVVEAMASGVPVVVTSSGGPKFLVRPGETGFVAANAGEFISAATTIARDSDLRRRMSAAARQFAQSQSWSRVFEGVYQAYRQALDASVPSLVCPAPVSGDFSTP